jgi:DNA-binding transcriptional LysR family regulator
LITKKTSIKRKPDFSFEAIPFIFREKGSGTRQTMEKYLKKNKIKVTKKMELTTNEAVKQAVLAGLGYSIMPLIGIKNELENKELEIVPVKGLPITTMWSLIWSKDKKLSPVAAAYLEFIQKNKQKIIQNNFNLFRNF